MRTLQFCISKHKGAHIYLEGKGAWVFFFPSKPSCYYDMSQSGSEDLEKLNHKRWRGEGLVRRRWVDRRLQDRRDVRREEHTTFAHSTEGNARHRGAEAVETRTSTELPEKKKREKCFCQTFQGQAWFTGRGKYGFTVVPSFDMHSLHFNPRFSNASPTCSRSLRSV